MSTYNKRTMVTLLPEWEPIFDRLKKERFYNVSKSEMIRYVIGLGLASLDKEKITQPENVEGERYVGEKAGLCSYDMAEE